MPVLGEQYGVAGDQQDAQNAAELWRFGPKAFKTYYNVQDPKDIQKKAEAEVPYGKVYADWPISTDPSVHRKAIDELFASGVTIVNVHSGQPDQHRVLQFYGQEVLPRIKR